MQQIVAVVRRLAVGIQVVSLMLLLLATCSVRAQLAGTGSIQGNIVDATGAAIPHASVTLIEESTQVKRTAVSDTSGVYTFPNINIGTYTIRVGSPGFSTYVSTGNVLEVGSSISLDVKMAVGATDSTVEVKADALALQTEDVSFKQTIDQQTVTEMPLNGRQMTDLITLSGGSTAAPGGDFTGSKYSYQTISVSIAGGMGNTTQWRLDGGDNNDYMANGNLPFPFPDAVSQFSVESTALSAQSGMHTGGLVNVVTRSGTNAYHGSAFEFLRNNIINSSNFFSATKDSLHQNQYGGTFGGKIRRDKLFAFAGYQHLHQTQSQNSVSAFVPTAANLAGDFSVTDPLTTANSCNSKLVQLKDPITGAALPGNKYATPPTFSAQGLALVKYLPKIDPALDPNNCGLVKYAIPLLKSDNEFVTRVDYTINAKHNLYGRYFIDGYQAPAFFSPTNILITTQSGNVQRVQTFTLGESYAISSKLVNSFHVTVMRRRNDRGYAPNDINLSNLGVSIYQAVPNGLQIAASKFTIGGGTNSVSHFNDNTLAIDDDVTLLKGKHQIVFGGGFTRNQLNISNAYETNGNLAFDGRYSLNGPGGGSAGGDPLLDVLSGTLSSFEQSKFQQNALRGNIPNLYVQDTYHATKGLTVVAGLRWSPEFLPVDVFNRGSIFDMAGFLANKVSTVYPNAPAGSFFYGDPGVTRQFSKSSPWQFSPNIGVSFDPFGDGKTVIRGGAELAYDMVNYFTSQRTQQNPPFATAIKQTQTATSGPILFAAPWSAGSITTSPFPQPAIPTPATAQFFAQSQYISMPPHFHPSYTEQWTFSVQHQFPRDWQLQVDYIGSHTVHAPMGTPTSPAVFIPGVWGANGTGCAGVVLTGPAGKAAGAAGTPCSTVANQAQRFALTIANPAQGNQYTGGGGGSVVVNNNGMANYNGVVTTIQHRLSSTFSLLANHTWSKCLNLADAQGDLASTLIENPANPMGDYAACGSDYRHVENIVLIAKSHFHLSNRMTSLLVNGWEIAPLSHIVSGAPFNVTAGQDNSFTDVSQDRPNLLPGVPVYLHQQIKGPGTGTAVHGYLNPAAFAQVTAGCPTPLSPATCPGYGTYGNIGRNAFRGITNYQFDAQISRVFPIHERLTTTLRLEAFNVLNHPNFGTPTLNLTTSTFGQISSTANQPRIFQGSLKFKF